MSVLFSCFVLITFGAILSVDTSSPPVTLSVEDEHVILSNGVVNLNLTKPDGDVLGVSYNGVENLLETRLGTRRGYWDMSWGERGPSSAGISWQVNCTEFEVIEEKENQVEVSFRIAWTHEVKGMPPLNIDKRYVMLQGSSGFYTYAIFEHQKGWPDMNLYEARVAFRPDKERFKTMVIGDDRKREMPTEDDRLPERSEPLAFKEAVLLSNPENPMFKGEVDDKYQYAMENKDSKVHGWTGSDPSLGFWVITPSIEFKTGGPLKQDLTSHAGPIALSMFVSLHYAGDELAVQLRNGEHWKKVFGPVFIYLNSNPDTSKLWEDAKNKMETETKSWPYNFPASEDFPKTNQRGSISGKLLVTDSLSHVTNLPASSAHVGLAPPGEPGSWQRESKGYQFWTTTDKDGAFSISNVRAGEYNLYAWVPGFIGSALHLKDLVYEPPRDGPTIWEIGIPDRSAAEFYIPDPKPSLVNKLYLNIPTLKYKQYGLWDRYTDLYPNEDLDYTVNISDYRKDWFFAHVNRRIDDANKLTVPTTWRITFNLPDVVPSGTYKLRIALASATSPTLHARFNSETGTPQFSTRRVSGRDNAIARHGIHGLYWLFTGDIPGSSLVEGRNVMFLSQVGGKGVFAGIMYDYLRLEAPST